MSPGCWVSIVSFVHLAVISDCIDTFLVATGLCRVASRRKLSELHVYDWWVKHESDILDRIPLSIWRFKFKQLYQTQLLLPRSVRATGAGSRRTAKIYLLSSEPQKHVKNSRKPFSIHPTHFKMRVTPASTSDAFFFLDWLGEDEWDTLADVPNLIVNMNYFW